MNQSMQLITMDDYYSYYQPTLNYLLVRFPLVLDYLRVFQAELWDDLPPKLIFNTADSDFINAICSLHKKHDFQTYSFQHGQMQTPISFRSHSQVYLVWTDFERDLIQRYSYNQQYISNFYPKEISEFQKSVYQISHPIPEIGIFTNAIHEIYGKEAIEDFIGILKQLLKKYTNECRFVFNIHPAENIKMYHQHFPENTILQRQAQQVLQQADLIITVYSTIFIEALNYQKPILVWRSFIDENETLIDCVNPVRLFKTWKELDQKFNNLLTLSRENKDIDLTPERDLFYTYFGKNFKRNFL